MFIRCLPNVFCAKSLEQLDKRHCNLTHIPDEIFRHQRTLEELFLDSNQLRDLPKALFRSTQLRRLTISDNEINRIPTDIGCLHLLQEFDCSRNEIFEIPEEIRFCHNLQVFDISGNPLQNGLPIAIVSLINLSHLTLNDISLTQLPENIGNLENLRCLEARENLLRVIPDSLCDLLRLLTLDLGNNEISTLPSSIGQLQNLRELWLDVNELTTIPDEIAQLKRLQCVDLSSNKLTALTDSVGQLSALTILELSQNRLVKIPDSIGRLKSLTVLKIDQNQLECLPDTIGWCNSLSELILTSNRLHDIPDTIGHLTALRHINLDRNELESLPKSICDCSQLGILSLRFNSLESLPDDLGKLNQLRVLDLTSNRIRYLPYSLLNICSDSNTINDQRLPVAFSPHSMHKRTISIQMNLKAIWLSENQARPLLRLQEEIIESHQPGSDGKTAKKVLTCYLLPQTQYSTPSTENLMSLTAHSKQQRRLRSPQQALTDPDRFPAQFMTNNNTLSQSSQTSKSVKRCPSSHDLAICSERSGSVKFSIDAQLPENDQQKNPSMCSRSATLLRRQNTPHPREFKAWKRKSERLLNDADDIEDDVSSLEDHEKLQIKSLESTNNDLHRVDAFPTATTTTQANNSRRCTDRPITYQADKKLIQSIVIEKPSRFLPLGLSIVGGSDQTSRVFATDDHPIGSMKSMADNKNDMSAVSISKIRTMTRQELRDGIYIFKVQKDGLAWKNGLRAGDRIVAVNGKCIEHATHHEAVKALMDVTCTSLELKIQRSESMANDAIEEVYVTRQNANEPLGIKLNGGIGSNQISLRLLFRIKTTRGDDVNPEDPNDVGIFITEVIPNGASDRTGRIRVGQQILAIDNQSLYGCKLEDALELLSGHDGCLVKNESPIKLTVCAGYSSVVGPANCSSAPTNQESNGEIDEFVVPTVSDPYLVVACSSSGGGGGGGGGDGDVGTTSPGFMFNDMRAFFESKIRNEKVDFRSINTS